MSSKLKKNKKKKVSVEHPVSRKQHRNADHKHSGSLRGESLLERNTSWRRRDLGD